MKRYCKSILSIVLFLCILSGCAETKPYDALSDPNVLWGEEVPDYEMIIDIPSGSVILAPRLGKTVTSAGEEKLIAFEVQMVYYYKWPTDITRLAIPDELAGDPVLIAKIEAYNQSPRFELYKEIDSYVDKAVSSQESLEFYYSWKRIEAEGVRERFIELGFVPVYSLDDLPSSGTVAREQVLTFVGSADSILGLEEKLSSQEPYYILELAEKREIESSE